MANNYLTPDIIAKEALRRLKNNLVMTRTVNRSYESKFGQIGDTITVPKPIRYDVKDGKTYQRQDVTEGSAKITVDKQKHVGIGFSSKDLALDPVTFGQKFIEPGISQLAHQVDMDLAGLFKDVPSWAGTPGQTINAWSDFAKGPERLDLLGVPQNDRYAVLSPTDCWALLADKVELASSDQLVNDAYTRALLKNIAGIDVMMSQQVRTHTVGDHGGTPLVDGADQTSTYVATKDTGTQTLTTDGWTATKVLKAGDVFTIDGVFDVNPNTKDALPHLKQFTIVSDVTTAANAANDTNLTIYPAIVTDGPYKNVSAAPANNAAITYLGTANTGYRQNMVYHRNAFALAVVPLPTDPSMSFASTQVDADTGLSVRIVRDYDLNNDEIPCRIDILYGVKAIYPELATRLSGTA